MNKDIIGNLTTIIKICIMTVAPAIAVYIGTSEQTVTAFLTAVLTFALAVLDAKYPNTFTQTVEPSKPTYNGDIYDNDAPLNPEYESDDDGC